VTANIKLALTKLAADVFDVRHFSVREAMNDLFEVNIIAASLHEDVAFDSMIGQGAALYLDGTKVRVWGGVVASVTQLHGELPAAKKKGKSNSASTYRVVVVPTLWRTTLRKNSRIFQHLSTKDIVLKLLKEWGIEPDVSKLKGTYKAHEYIVQYGETDYAFISRLLEDAGITFYFDHSTTSGPADKVTKLVFDDAPHTAAPRADPLALVTAHDLKWGVNTFACADVTLTQRVRPGRFTIRDFDFRRPLTAPIIASATIGASDTKEQKLEQYHYVPGMFWFDEQQGGGTPNADDLGIARTDPKEGEAKITGPKDPSPVLINQEMQAERRRRLLVSFQTNATDILPGTIVGINQGSGTTDNHPRTDLAPDKKLLVYETHLEGYAHGDWGMRVSAVFAEFVYRPERRMPRPRIYGVQSAIVVGPPGKEIHTDEFGRVRVQFHWDREGKYDHKSSCWMRVSQTWAGNGFGTIHIPRVGHEVLVEFFEGDPDHPVIVGRVYNNTSYGGALAPGVPYKLPDEKTKTGIKTDSSSGGHGYNEMVFDDKKGSESIHFQAEKNFSYTVKDSESASVGKSRSATIGGSDAIDIGKARTIHVGKSYTIGAGNEHTTAVGKRTSIKMTDGAITMSTEKASVTIEGGNIALNASEGIVLRGAKAIELMSQGGTLTMQGGPQVRFDDGESGPPIKVAPPVPADPAAGPAKGASSGPPFKPVGGSSIDKPMGIDDVTVKPPSPTLADAGKKK
jgi:type VI secretion system secreted protein VgrG